MTTFQHMYSFIWGYSFVFRKRKALDLVPALKDVKNTIVFNGNFNINNP